MKNEKNTMIKEILEHDSSFRCTALKCLDGFVITINDMLMSPNII